MKTSVWRFLAPVLLGTFAVTTPARAEEEKPKQIIVNSAGGSFAAVIRKYFWSEFEKKYGIRVVDTSPTDLGKLRAMVESKNVAWAMTEVGAQDAVRAKDLGLAEPLDERVIDRSQFAEQARDKIVFSPLAYSTVMAYRTDVFPAGGPKSWADFWDVKKFPGPRSMRDDPVDNLEAALLADGVQKDKLYPLDVDRAFKKLDEIYPYVSVWWTTGQQPAQLLLDKEVVLATGWNGRFYSIIRKGAPIAFEWEGGILKLGSFVVPKGSRDAAWGMKVLAGMADAKAQAGMSGEIGYSGTNLASNEFVPADIRPLLPLSPENRDRQVWLSVNWWTQNGAALAERWQKWKLQKEH